ncbi:DNA-binding protein [Clavibacter michiganensis]|uniref:DNA-binding protein n=1 Tax=Clavibacter michiganensis TaxID=28447 RepID=A0A2S5VNV0_9MICO|nr:helix-turn-helix domain-containing protein [Clavibacter michiganensis]PPF64715.1 DNA-binding protein [Clavibacter michiganensis]
MPKLDASSVPATEIDVLDQTSERLPAGALRVALETLSLHLRGGEDMFVLTEKSTLTPSEAAGLLGISRTHLYKVLDSGALAHHVVGSRDRRISATDLVEYRGRMFAAQKRVAESVARADDFDDLTLDEFE